MSRFGEVRRSKAKVKARRTRDWSLFDRQGRDPEKELFLRVGVLRGLAGDYQGIACLRSVGAAKYGPSHSKRCKIGHGSSPTRAIKAALTAFTRGLK